MSRLDELRAAKDLMWESMECVSDMFPEKRASLMGQWRALEVQIAELAAKDEKAGDPVDQLAARRAARGGATARLGLPAGGTV